jgi:hypothetical protein
MSESFRDWHARLDSSQRQQLAQRARLDTGMLAPAARSSHVAGWVQARIAEQRGQPRVDLFPRRRDDDHDPRHREPDDRAESWLRRSRAASRGTKS